MKKFTQKLACLLMVMLCCVSLHVKAEDLTVASGTATSSNVPAYGLYADTQGARSQCLYPADSLSEMNGGTISQMTFYLSSSATEAWTGTFQVRIGETEATSLSSGWIEDDLVTVYTGAMDATGTTLTVVFDDAYTYNGGNLVFDWLVTTAGNYKSASFYCVSLTGAGRYRSSSSATGSTVGYLPKCTFEYIAGGGGPTCDKPSGITASDLTFNSATLTWADGSGVYNVQYKAADDTVWTPVITEGTELTAALTGLEGSTTYSARVQSYCAALDTVSSWRSVSFTTPMAPMELPLNEKFNTSSVPANWERFSGLVDDVLAGTAQLVSTTSGWNFSTGNGVFDNHAKINIFGSTCKYWLVTPVIALEHSPALNFDLALTTYSGTTPAQVDKTQQLDDRFIVLITTDNGATWTILREWNNQGSEYIYNNISFDANGEHVTIDLAYYNGAAVQIAFYGESTATGGDNNLHIDNVNVDYVPTCFSPTELALSNLTKTGANISWTANTGESAWIFEYKKNKDKNWQSVNVTGTPSYALADLDAYTDYDVRVAAICDPNDELGTSRFSEVLSFKTAAGIPFIETFDSSLPTGWNRYNCWIDSILADPENYHLEETTSGWTVGSGNGVFVNTDNHLKLQIYSATCNRWIVTPFIEMEDNVQLTFDLALTKNTGNLTPVDAGGQDDDRFYVLVMAEGGENWEELVYWDNQGSVLPYDNISYTAEGQIVKLDLSAYAGQSIALAFYGESSVANGNNYLHIDNVRVDYIPNCAKPTGLAVSNVLDTAATFTWDEAEDGAATWAYGIIANPSDSIVITDADFTATTEDYAVTIDTLADETEYMFILRRACAGSNSEEVVRKFKTLPLPENVPWSENFDSMTNNTVPEYWDNTASTSSTITGANKHYIWGVFAANGNNVIRMYNSLVQKGTALINSPRITLPVETAYELTFNYSHRANCDAFHVNISADNGESWTDLGAFAATASTNTTDPGEFTEATIHLGAFAGDTVMLQFYAVSTYGSGAIFVDNIDIHEAPACPKPAGLEEVLESATMNSVQFDWVPVGGEHNWFVQYKKGADTVWTYVADSVKAHPYTLTGLEASSNYDIRVAAWCDPTDSLSAGQFCNPINIATLCGVIDAFPWLENFEGMPADQVPNCWDNTASSTSTVTGSNPERVWGVYEYNGNKMIRMYNYFVSSGTALINTPVIDLPAEPGYQLSFDYAHTATCGDFTVKISTNDGDNWTDLKSFGKTSTGTDKDNPGEFANATIKLGAYAGQSVLLQFFANANYGSGAIFVDNVALTELPSCAKPEGLTVFDVTAAGASFTWTAIDSAAYKYAVALASAAEPDDSAFIAAENDTVILTGLNDDSDYIVYLRLDCGAAMSESLTKAFHTKQLPAELPYEDDFEAGNNWLFINGTLENAWVYGEAAHNGEGSHAIYISNDGGTTNAYTNNKAAVVFATKAFNIPQGTYIFQYDWIANGESTYDYIRVALVPADVELVAATALPTGVSTTTLPDGWIALDGGSKLNLSTAWATINSGEIVVPESGIYNVVILWRDDTSGGTNPPAAIDNFSISKVACPAVSNIAVSDITFSSAAISWTPGNDEQNAWDIVLTLDPNVDLDSAAVLTVDTIPYLAEALEADTTYYLFIRSNCGDTVSAWSDAISFNTASACAMPDNFALEAVSVNSATLSWDGYGHEVFNFSYSADTAAGWIDSLNVTMPFTINGLTANTKYFFKAQPICAVEDSAWSAVWYFKTAYGVPFVENFDGTSMPADWQQAQGLLSDILNGDDFTSGSMWYFGAGSNGVFDNHARINIYGTSRKHWLITPKIHIEGNVQLSFDLALTKYSGTLQPVDATQQLDDKFVVLITADGGESWQILRQWDNDSTAEYVYNNIACTAEGEPVAIALNGYNGQDVYIAFYGESTVTGGDNNLHIDNVLIDIIPTCLKPTGLAVSNVKDTTATFAWDNVENGAWDYAILANAAIDSIPAEAAFTTITTNHITVNNLTLNTPYVFFLRANCGEEDGVSAIIAKAFHTTLHPTALPFADDFENGNNWLLLNDTLENAWVVDTAAHYGEGTHGLYISNDGGATNAYNPGTYGAMNPTMVYATKLLDFPIDADYAISYDWKANGEGNYDFLRVALVPADIELEASTAMPTGFNYSTLPAGWIALDGGSKLNLSEEWANKSVEVEVPAGVYNLVFAWRNDNTDGNQTPGAVDNVNVAIACHAEMGATDSILFCPGETITWNEKEYNEAGVYNDTLLNIYGCDSVATLVLELYAPEDTLYAESEVDVENLPFTYQNAEHPYIPGQAPIFYSEATAKGVYVDTVLVMGENCAAVLVHTLTVTDIHWGIDNVDVLDGAHKFIYRDNLYIRYDDQLYNAEGKKVEMK